MDRGNCYVGAWTWFWSSVNVSPCSGLLQTPRCSAGPRAAPPADPESHNSPRRKSAGLFLTLESRRRLQSHRFSAVFVAFIIYSGSESHPGGRRRSRPASAWSCWCNGRRRAVWRRSLRWKSPTWIHSITGSGGQQRKRQIHAQRNEDVQVQTVLAHLTITHTSPDSIHSVCSPGDDKKISLYCVVLFFKEMLFYIHINSLLISVIL